MISDLFASIFGGPADYFGSTKNNMYKESMDSFVNVITSLHLKKEYSSLKDVVFEDSNLMSVISMLLSEDSPKMVLEHAHYLKERIDSPELPDSDVFTLQMMGFRKE